MSNLKRKIGTAFDTKFLENGFDSHTLDYTKRVVPPYYNRNARPWPAGINRVVHNRQYSGAAARQMAVVLQSINQPSRSIVEDPSTTMGHNGNGEPINIQYIPDWANMKHICCTNHPADLCGKEEILFLGTGEDAKAAVNTHIQIAPPNQPHVLISINKLNALMRHSEKRDEYSKLTRASDILSKWRYIGVQIHDPCEGERRQQDMRAIGVTIHNRVVMPNIWIEKDDGSYQSAAQLGTRLYILLCKENTGDTKKSYWRFKPYSCPPTSRTKPPRHLYTDENYIGAAIFVGVVANPWDGFLRHHTAAIAKRVGACLNPTMVDDSQYRDVYMSLPKVEVMLVDS